MNIFNFY